MKVLLELDDDERFWLYDLLRDSKMETEEWEIFPQEVKEFYVKITGVLN